MACMLALCLALVGCANNQEAQPSGTVADSSSIAASDADSSASSSASEATSDAASSSSAGVADADVMKEWALAEDAAYAPLKKDITALVEASGIDVGMVCVDVSDPTRLSGFDVQGDMPLIAASMIKLIVLATFLDAVDQGTLSMEEPYVIQSEDIVGGTGSVQSAGAGASYTLAELARLMISESDNVAANVLINRLGMDAVNAEAEKLGLENTHLNRLMMDETAMGRHVENIMSAADAAKLLTLIWHKQLVSAEASAFALEALEAQTDGAGIAEGLPDGTAFAHKTGTLAQVKNDGGIVETEKPYVLVVFCSGGDSAASMELMSRISSMVYEQFD